jgi:Repeat of unknown function (DUF5648)
MYRLYSAGWKDHFYTNNPLHKLLATRMGFNEQGTLGRVASIGTDALCPCLRPIHRLYNSALTNHFYTR